MNTALALTLELPAEEDTLSLGSALSRGIEPGALLFLQGDLGCGKTTLVRGLMRGLGFEGRVKSPTFALVEAYELSRLSLYHFDLYRFEDAQELRDSGLLENFESDAVCIVEWPEKASGSLPVADLTVQLSLAVSGGRTAVLEARTPRGAHWLKAARLC